MTGLVSDQGAFNWFVSLLYMIRTQILEKFILPHMNISYWQFAIGLAVAAVVITVLVNVVRIGSASSSTKENSRPFKDR